MAHKNIELTEEEGNIIASSLLEAEDTQLALKVRNGERNLDILSLLKKSFEKK